jgi:hypothetical protein
MDIATVWTQFGDMKRKATEGYRQFMLQGSDQGHDPRFSGGELVRSLGGWANVLSMRRKDQQEKADERILGSGDFSRNTGSGKRVFEADQIQPISLTLTKCKYSVGG